MIIFRAAFRELLHPFSMTLFVMIGLLLMENAYRLVNLLVAGKINLVEAGTMLMLLLPQSLAVILPLAVVGAVFVVVIRQSTDSEVVALRASGHSLWSYAAPFITFGALLTLITIPVSMSIQPWALRQYESFQLDMVRWRAEQEIIPGIFNTDFGDKVIHIKGREGEVLQSIFIGDAVPKENATVITAQTGIVETDQEEGQVILKLQEGQVLTHSQNFQVLRTANFKTLRYVLDFEPAKAISPKKLRNEGSLEIWQISQDPSERRGVRTKAYNEFFLRLAVPFACLAFALASIPMALIDPRSGKKAGFLRAIFLVAAYNIVWLAFKDLIRSGKAPTMMIWLPSALILSYGILKLWQANADIESWWQLFRRRRSSG